MQKSTGIPCWPHRSAPTGSIPGHSQGRRRRERGPSPRCRSVRPPRNWYGSGAEGEAGDARFGSSRSIGRASRPQARVGAISAHEGDPEGHSQHGERRSLSGAPSPRGGGILTADAKWSLSVEGIHDQRRRRPSRGGGGSGLGGSRPGDAARRRGAHLELARERRHGCQRLAASASSGRTPPSWQPKKLRAMQPAEAETTGGVNHLLPRPRGRPQSLSLPHQASREGCTWWTHREPTSTGARSREVWVADIGRTYRGCLSGGPSQDDASEITSGTSAQRKPNLREENLLTTRGGGERANAVRRVHALSFRTTRWALVAGEGSQGLVTVSGVLGFATIQS